MGRLGRKRGQQLPIRLNEPRLTSKLTSMCCKVWNNGLAYLAVAIWEIWRMRGCANRSRVDHTDISRNSLMTELFREALPLCPFVLNLVTVYRWPICGQKVRGEFGEQQSVLLQLTSMCFLCLSTMIDWLNQSNRLSCLKHCQSNKKIFTKWRRVALHFFARPPPV